MHWKTAASPNGSLMRSMNRRCSSRTFSATRRWGHAHQLYVPSKFSRSPIIRLTKVGRMRRDTHTFEAGNKVKNSPRSIYVPREACGLPRRESLLLVLDTCKHLLIAVPDWRRLFCGGPTPWPMPAPLPTSVARRFTRPDRECDSHLTGGRKSARTAIREALVQWYQR